MDRAKWWLPNWIASAVIWLAEKLWGDQAFAWLRSMIPQRFTELETVLRMAWAYGIPVILFVVGICILIRSDKDRKAKSYSPAIELLPLAPQTAPNKVFNFDGEEGYALRARCRIKGVSIDRVRGATLQIKFHSPGNPDKTIRGAWIPQGVAAPDFKVVGTASLSLGFETRVFVLAYQFENEDWLSAVSAEAAVLRQWGRRQRLGSGAIVAEVSILGVGLPAEQTAQFVLRPGQDGAAPPHPQIKNRLGTSGPFPPRSHRKFEWLARIVGRRGNRSSA